MENLQMKVIKLNNQASILSQNLNNSLQNQNIIYPDKNNIWSDEKSLINEKEEDPFQFNLKFNNFNKNQFTNNNNIFSINFNQSNNANSCTNNINQQNNNTNNYNQDYFIEENENLTTNQINNMKIKPNNLIKLNDINAYGIKSYTDPSCDEIYENNKFPTFLFSPTEKKQKSRIFPVIEGNNKNQTQDDDSFDYTNLNEE